MFSSRFTGRVKIHGHYTVRSD